MEDKDFDKATNNFFKDNEAEFKKERATRILEEVFILTGQDDKIERLFAEYRMREEEQKLRDYNQRIPDRIFDLLCLELGRNLTVQEINDFIDHKIHEKLVEYKKNGLFEDWMVLIEDTEDDDGFFF